MHINRSPIDLREEDLSNLSERIDNRLQVDPIVKDLQQQ